ARRNADVAREGEWDGPQRALVDAGCSGQVGQRVGVAGEHREVRADAGLARGAGRAHRRPALGVRHAELARRLAAVGVEWHVDLIAQLPEDDDARPAGGGGAVVLRHAELARVELAVRAHATDPAATVKAGPVRTIAAGRTRQASLDDDLARRADRERATVALVINSDSWSGDNELTARVI